MGNPSKDIYAPPLEDGKGAVARQVDFTGTLSSSLLIALYAAVVIGFTVAHMDSEPYDDGHFFKRVALNFLDTGRLVWNRDEAPAYGSTSQLFQWLAVPVVALWPAHYMLAMRVLAGAVLACAFAFMLRLTRQLDYGLASVMAFLSPALLYPVLSGMETTLVFLLIAAFLWLLFDTRNARLHWLVLPSFVGLVYFARPDATLLVVPPLLAERWLRDRKLPVREVLTLAVLLTAMLASFRLYYGTALPLPFYAKQAAFTPYDAHFISLSNAVRSVRFGVFTAFALPLLLLGLQKRDWTNLVLIGSAIAFIGYHYFLTIEVMGMHGRFYAPATPLLAFAAARGIHTMRDRGMRIGVLSALMGAFVFVMLRWRGWLPGDKGFSLERVDFVTYLSMPCILLACVAAARSQLQPIAAAGLLVFAASAQALNLPGAGVHIYSDEDFLALQTSRYTVYRGIDTLRGCFGDAIHVYHSEVGLPGLRFQHGQVSDLAGLLSKRWLFEGRGGFDKFCLEDKPDAIFLPHKNYKALNQEIAESACIKQYRRVIKKSSSPLYIRNDLYPRFRECAAVKDDPYLIP